MAWVVSLAWELLHAPGMVKKKKKKKKKEKEKEEKKEGEGEGGEKENTQYNKGNKIKKKFKSNFLGKG